ncbi:hypothetical protein MARU1_001008 [Malassezia arunalokei]|uniref:GH16 domain-containing protein n=1 Tax=Malassezia arunalokei TaxID=1514897 RepID=A0AAJ5YXY6_9BASI|nr:hypothetical protein MARU1_001008 [Malassezia arunalokei]
MSPGHTGDLDPEKMKTDAPKVEHLDPRQQKESIEAGSQTPDPAMSQNIEDVRSESFVSEQRQGSVADAASTHSDVQHTAVPYSWMSGYDDNSFADDLHDPAKPLRGAFEPKRAVLNVGTLIILVLCLLMLFAGYPILHHYTEGNGNDDRINDFRKIFDIHSPIPDDIPISRANSSKLQKAFDDKAKMMIDPDTPEDAFELSSTFSKSEGKKFKLVFSDEFNTDGRSFYPGEDPFWEAVDLHYWATNNYEWYDPAAVYTKDGSLRLRLDQHQEHNSYFRGGMLQSWNKFCFRNGILIASIQLPGYRSVAGLWPAFWIMGNLGRAGYGATLQGTWPYSYDHCDVGTLMNQTLFDSDHPDGYPRENLIRGGATAFNEQHETRSLSFLPGQKLSRCTCPGEDHPGPFKNGQFVGRSAPEIDVFEAQKQGNNMGVSQSCQMAPYNFQYDITYGKNKSDVYQFFSREGSLNPYNGEITQQSLSGTALASQEAIQYVADSLDTTEEGNFATYSLEFKGGSDGHVSWTSNGRKTWELYPGALAPDNRTLINSRQYPKEPMYIIMNLGISKNFGDVEWDDIMEGFPYEMAVDWVRVYQDPDDPESDTGCSPEDMPTSSYIERHMEAYTNTNLTVWGGTRDDGGYGAYWPLNRMYSKGCKGTRSKEPGDPDRPLVTASRVPSASVTRIPGAQPFQQNES